MKILRKTSQMFAFSRQVKCKGRTLGFVPTMGALHEGHLSLIRRAARENDAVVVSIFVNPIQFGPKEDFKKYPRTFSHDARLCKREGVSAIFYPAIKELYPAGYKTYVTVEDLSIRLCGASRPGHFKGVATVVTKLFNIVNPDTAYFGQKDAQQAVIIKKMVLDLNMPVKIKVMPTLRDKDGLALSSRNVYLNKEEREDALVLSQALNLAKGLIKAGARDSSRIINSLRQLIQRKKSAQIDYISIVDSFNLRPIKRITNGCIIALAVRIGKTRLIDNIIISKTNAGIEN
jgi:pantoate--beta-alanine ligase